MGLKQAAAAGDFLYELTELGFERARRCWEHCTYFGSVPVSLKDYVASVRPVGPQANPSSAKSGMRSATFPCRRKCSFDLPKR